jgi:hypothetical protein
VNATVRGDFDQNYNEIIILLGGGSFGLPTRMISTAGRQPTAL